MNGYISIWRGERVETYDDTLLGAKQKAIVLLQAKAGRRKVKAHEVTTMLAELNGQPYTHVAVD